MNVNDVIQLMVRQAVPEPSTSTSSEAKSTEVGEEPAEEVLEFYSLIYLRHQSDVSELEVLPFNVLLMYLMFLIQCLK